MKAKTQAKAVSNSNMVNCEGVGWRQTGNG